MKQTRRDRADVPCSPQAGPWRLSLALAVATGACAAPAEEDPATPTERPNLVYILADDLGYGDLSCLNEDAAWETAHLDRLAAEGMAFTDAHSGSAVCTPTRYGVLTGRYAWRTRLKQGVLDGESPPLIEPGRMTVASYLREQGYRTAFLGKWHLGWDWARAGDGSGEIDFTRPVDNGPTRVGFESSYGVCASLDMSPYVWVEDGLPTAEPDRVTVNDDYQGFWRQGATAPDFDHVDALPELTRRAVRYVHERAAEDDPFFLYLALPAPHTPILPTPEFQGRSGTNPYGDFVLQVDDTVGQVLEALDQAGIARDTLVVFTSDNGCSPRARFEELATFGHDPSYVYRGHKADIFEGGHRVPFLVRWPARVAPGSRSDETICLTDLLRTCANLLGSPLPADAGEDSVSFAPALLGATDGRPLREATVHHSINGSFAIRVGSWKLALCPGSGGWSDPVPAAARQQGLPLVQLYDLASDPGETTNLAPEEPEQVERMIALLERYVASGRSTPGPAQPSDADETPFLPAGFERGTPIAARHGFDRSEVVYKTVGDAPLKLHVYRPTGTSGPSAAIVFFFGGGWNGGSPGQFFPHCEHLASRGMVAISAEYRVRSRHGASPFDCVADARSALRYVRAHADELGVDPTRVAAGGGSAGGHLAAAIGTVPVPVDERMLEAVSSRPDALVLFNPVFDNGPDGFGYERVGERYREISPIDNLDRGGLPPTVVFLGSEDRLVPVATAEAYRARMEAHGNRCELHLYEGQAHGFFNENGGETPYYDLTVEVMDRFLAELGFLPGA